ncbi:MAG: HIT family protein [Methanoculleus sp.]|jgi:hypothetical protein|nr:HIT family protein [Methanoculleus sp.]
MKTEEYIGDKMFYRPRRSSDRNTPTATSPASSTQRTKNSPHSSPSSGREKTLLDEQFHPDGYNVSEAAGQTVMHLHVHLILRYAGDAEDPRGGVRGAVPEKRYLHQVRTGVGR